MQYQKQSVGWLLSLIRRWAYNNTISNSSLISSLSSIDLVFEDFSSFKTSVWQELNLIKQELYDVKQNTNKSDRQSCNYCNKAAVP